MLLRSVSVNGVGKLNGLVVSGLVEPLDRGLGFTGEFLGPDLDDAGGVEKDGVGALELDKFRPFE